MDYLYIIFKQIIKKNYSLTSEGILDHYFERSRSCMQYLFLLGQWIIIVIFARVSIFPWFGIFVPTWGGAPEAEREKNQKGSNCCSQNPYIFLGTDKTKNMWASGLSPPHPPWEECRSVSDITEHRTETTSWSPPKLGFLTNPKLLQFKNQISNSNYSEKFSEIF